MIFAHFAFLLLPVILVSLTQRYRSSSLSHPPTSTSAAGAVSLPLEGVRAHESVTAKTSREPLLGTAVQRPPAGMNICVLYGSTVVEIV